MNRCYPTIGYSSEYFTLYVFTVVQYVLLIFMISPHWLKNSGTSTLISVTLKSHCKTCHAEPSRDFSLR